MDIFAEYKLYPNEEDFILSHYKGFYESVFVAFLPFFKVKNQSSEKISVQKSHQISYEQLVAENKLFANIQKFNAEIYSNENADYPEDKTIFEYGEIVNWQEINNKTNFKNFAELNKALKTSIGSYRQVFKRPDLLEVLNLVTERERIFHPTEGTFTPLAKVQIYNSLKHLGKNEIVVLDEYLETTKELNLDLIHVGEFIEKLELKDYYIYPKDKSILYTIEWDSFFYLVCSNQVILDEILKVVNFEGFFCTDETKHGWDWTTEEITALFKLEKMLENDET
ncbi:MAG: DUF2711 domain-containing protein [Acidobacteriota bacterium]|nr:DUF2711 domain-containing protein [Acidobacteriota bacterium]